MEIIINSFCNAVIFGLYCYLVTYIILKRQKFDLKKIAIASIPFLLMYYCTLCLLDSLFSIFFSGLCAFFFIRIIFKESIYMSMFLSLVMHIIKTLNKMLMLVLIGNDNLLLVNTYKTLKWIDFYVNFVNLLISFFIIFLLRKPLRKLVRFVSGLKNRKLILIVAVYMSFIMICLYQPPYETITLQSVTDFLLIITLTWVGVFNVSTEMKTEALTKHYQEIFEYSKTNEQLVNNYKMQVHENKNKWLMLRSILEGPKKDAIKYVDSIIKEIHEDDSNYWLTELKYLPLPGVRNFINYKLVKLKNMGAQIEVFVSSDLQDIDASPLSDKDYNQLTTILGVILDNMIESIKETDEKLVSVYIYLEDDKIMGDFVNSYSGNIDYARLNEVGYTTKGEQHGVGLPIVSKITKNNERFECVPEVTDKFFIQHMITRLFSKQNLQKNTKK